MSEKKTQWIVFVAMDSGGHTTAYGLATSGSYKRWCARQPRAVSDRFAFMYDPEGWCQTFNTWAEVKARALQDGEIINVHPCMAY